MTNCAICGAHHNLVPLGQCSTCQRVTCMKCFAILSPPICKSCNTIPVSRYVADIRQFSNEDLLAELIRRGLDKQPFCVRDKSSGGDHTVEMAGYVEEGKLHIEDIIHYCAKHDIEGCDECQMNAEEEDK
jgi:hypothetical protein